MIVCRRVAIIILNWNGLSDTLECLESVFRLNYENYSVIICDNGSTDGSLDHLSTWSPNEKFRGNNHRLNHIFDRRPRRIKKSVRLTRVEAEQGKRCEDADLILIDNGANLGFAGGNNVGLRYALRCIDFEFVWLLNNDTVVDNDALRELVRRSSSVPRPGITGSTLLYYDEPDKVQAFGGARYISWIGLPVRIGRFLPRMRQVDAASVEKRMAYVYGASMFVSRCFLEDVGLLSEEYFLYYEELDWALRAGCKGRLGYAPRSLVYHKAGGSIGSSHRIASRSALADRYLMCNRIVITRKFFPNKLPGVYVFLMVEVVLRLLGRKTSEARTILRCLRMGGFQRRNEDTLDSSASSRSSADS